MLDTITLWLEIAVAPPPSKYSPRRREPTYVKRHSIVRMGSFHRGLAIAGTPMPTELGTAFLGLTVGGVTFFIAGLAISLTIGQLQERVIEARAPAANQASLVQYAQLPSER